MKTENTDKRTWLFEKAPISKAVWTLAIPTIITQLINIIYNYADTWYVGISFTASLSSVSYLVNAVFQGAGRRTESLLLSSLRKGILDIPGMFLFRHFFGAMGVVIATPVAEVLGVIIAALMYRNFRKTIS